ncbi:TPA: metal-dependent transcriptional regulator [Staphylococcus pseudintermedius]|uniref:metal-dependent transcriptional regulator n=1 Tax=Staphylococcus pseudintermedius TaxID=283734 RepID=UPI0018EF3DA1|nr:metal-dependent transcriptional regulator [Staphylococcus pseudintermedius]EGQ1726792.1 metal-dependent transcriptional regulator [Staphylococcus pseudintermedius]EIK0277412.1 metal-dependent transcriptional regulator [Staphylococcus pseudintermedius]EIX6372816.1 metal-dependent transcriptional regulator [Staphylococcus pseudintermedius]EJY3773084.1 metal-dependent transcriptional regulator [Staphylococcus pseudintermedius]ELJ9247436.1 metal-dependent transcriptional regulator [Staphylococc
MLTEEKEDYLKAILSHDGIDTYVSNKTLSRFLNIKPPSVSEMVGRLEKEGYVMTKPYKGVKLSELGLSYTLDVIKRHRLIELFLIEVLNYTWEEVHVEAEVLEHRVSKLFVERLDELLKYPKTCPHGGVIPRDNHFEEIYKIPLLSFEEGNVVTIRRVRDRSELLVFLSSKALSIGDTVKVIAKDDINRLMELENKGEKIVLSYQNAEVIFGEKA